MVGGAPRMIGSSPAWARAVEQATMAARSDARVLLIGESGTGKELLAAHIHNPARSPPARSSR
jgi:transcriptional regulator with PAS, ATPase and Fis domain